MANFFHANCAIACYTKQASQIIKIIVEPMHGWVEKVWSCHGHLPLVKWLLKSLGLI